MRKLHWFLLVSVMLLVGCLWAEEMRPTQYTLRVEVQGQGFVEPKEGVHKIPAGTLVNLRATASANWQFLRWEGPVSQTTTPETTLLMDGNKTVRAVFSSEDARVIYLEPGLVIEAVDGILVGAPKTLPKTWEVWMERALNPTDSIPLPSYLSGGSILGNFYSLQSKEDYETLREDYLLLGLPVEEGSFEGLGVLVLSPPERFLQENPDADPALRWILLPGRYDATNQVFGTLLSSLTTVPQYFALYKMAPDACNESLSVGNFSVSCLGFSTAQCNHQHKELTIQVLEEAYEAWQEMGFGEPDLRRELVEIDFSNPPAYTLGPYSYYLRLGKLNGAYYIDHRMAYTTYPGAPQAPEPRITRHEFFHSIQFGYPEFRRTWEEVSGAVAEGITVAHELSLTGLSRSSFEGRRPFSIHYPLFGSTGTFTHQDYFSQDFWVYLAKRLFNKEPELGVYASVFEQGGKLFAIENLVKTYGTFSSVSDAYWQWAKDYSLEKTVFLGFWDLEPIPMGFPGQWWQALGQKSRHTLEAGGISGGNREVFSLPPLSSRVVAVVLAPGEGTFSVELTVKATSEDLRYKIYDGTPNIHRFPEQQDITFTLSDEPLELYVLFANTSPYGGDSPVTLEVALDTPLSISDPNLEAVLRNLVGIPTGTLYASDFALVFDVRARNQGITTLSGIEPLGTTAWEGFGFRRLELRDNQISDLTPVARHKNLERLELTRNKVENLLALATFSSLKELDLRENQLLSLEGIQTHTQMGKLDVTANKITSLHPLRSMQQLWSLEFPENSVTSLDPLKDATQLTHLNGAGNQIVSIQPLENLTELIGLSLDRNGIWSLEPLALHTKLRSVGLSANQIRDVGPLVGSKDQLRSLNVSQNWLVEISSSWQGKEFPLLFDLDLSRNHLTQLDGLRSSSFPTLQNLKLQDNRLQDISGLSMSHMPRVTTLQLQNNRISNGEPIAEWSQRTELVSIHLEDNALVDLGSLAQVDFPKLTTWNLTRNALVEVSLSGNHLPSLRTLLLKDNLIQQLWLTGGVFPELSQLDLAGNPRILSLRFFRAEFPKLASLDLWENPILQEVRFDDAVFPLLRELNLRGKGMLHLSMERSSFPLLTTVNGDLNGLTSLNLTQASLPALESLQLQSNALTTLAGLSDVVLPSLVALNLSDNEIGQISSLSRFPSLEHLYLQGNVLVEIEVLGSLPKLKTVDLTNNPTLITNPDYTKVVDGQTIHVPRSAARAVIDALLARGCAVYFTLVYPKD